MGFASDIQTKIDKIAQNVDIRIYEYSKEYFDRVINNTPILTSLLSNSWYPTESSQPSSAVGGETNGPAESLTRVAAIGGQEVFYKKDGTVTLVNNQEYARLIENKKTDRGHMVLTSTESMQADYGGKQI